MRFTRFVVLAAALSLQAGLFATPASGVNPPGPSRFTATALTPDSTYIGAKSPSGAAAQSDPALIARTDATPVNVMIKYDFDATASYGGGVAGLAPTSPLVTGKKLKDNKGAVAAYDAYANTRSAKITGDVKKTVPSAQIGKSYSTAYGGVRARIPANQAARLLAVPGVVAVQSDTLNQPQDDNTAFIGATAVWPTIGGPANAGSNVIVGVLDTGIWPEHPMLAPGSLAAPDGGLRGCQFGNGSNPNLGPAFACNNKLIGAYAFTTTYMAVVGASGAEFCDNATSTCSPRDSEGHGTHTMTTAAGDCVASAMLYGVERGPICGLAPGAHVIEYRVCLAQGCFGSDSVDAVQQAITDGVDVINFSISGGASPYTDPVELAFLDAFNAGISVNASAGNSGPGAATSDHGGPWTTTVGASTGPRFFTSTLHLTADGGATFDMPGVTLTNGIASATPVVLAESLSGEDQRCQTPLASGAAAGKIVACRRGGNARVDKGFNVFQGGAAGMILYNAVKQDVETDNHWLPAIHVDGPSTSLLAFIAGHTNVKATWLQGTPSATQPDVMASFSSRGPLGDWIKPDVTAPGIQVLAGMTPQPDQSSPTNGPSGNLYQAIAGTSMSSPHSAGASALVKAAHPDWTPAEIKSALMTSSLQAVVKEDGVTPADPFDMGAGSIRVNRAVSPTLVFNETAANYLAAATSPLTRIDLNLSSINAPVMTGTITTKRTAINVSGRDQDLDVSIATPAGATITVSDKKPGPNGPGASVKKLHASKNKPLEFWVTISGPALANGQYFGRITLDPKQAGANAVTIPVAFNRTQGQVSLTHVCSPTTVARNALAHCLATVTNLGSAPAAASLTVTDTDKSKGLDFSNITAPASAIKKNDGAQWSGTLSPALAPTVVAITNVTGSSPVGGYLPLSLFGIAPIAGVGDESITNFNVPTFYYGGEAYTRIGIVSNGYVVLGGGTGADVDFAPQLFPNPTRPNNVVAPFWNDLNPPAGGAIRIGSLSDGVNDWLIVDYAAVKNFSDLNTHTGEIWFQLSGGGAGTGPASEQITITYGAANMANGDPSGINAGAENRDGSSGQNLATPANDTEWAVILTPPTAGGSVTIGYDASSKKAGTYTSLAQMTSSVTPGITQVVQAITVTP